MEESITSVAKRLGKAMLKRTKAKIAQSSRFDNKEVKLEYLQEYYSLLKEVVPVSEENRADFTMEKMVTALEDPDLQSELMKQFDALKEQNFEDLMKVIANNPNLSLEDLKNKTKKQT